MRADDLDGFLEPPPSFRKTILRFFWEILKYANLGTEASLKYRCILLQVNICTSNWNIFCCTSQVSLQRIVVQISQIFTLFCNIFVSFLFCNIVIFFVSFFHF